MIPQQTRMNELSIRRCNRTIGLGVISQQEILLTCYTENTLHTFKVTLIFV